MTQNSVALTRESIVVAICQFVVDKDRHCAVFVLQALLDHRYLVFGHLQTGPAIPLEGGGLGQTAESAHQTSRGHGKVVFAIFGALNGDGKAVGHEQQAGLVLGFFDRGHGEGGIGIKGREVKEVLVVSRGEKKCIVKDDARRMETPAGRWLVLVSNLRGNETDRKEV